MTLNMHLISLIVCTAKIVCYAADLITNVEANWPGLVHDDQMYQECSLSNRFGNVNSIYYIFFPFLKQS